MNRTVLLESLRLAALRIAHMRGVPASVKYEAAREVWGVWWEVRAMTGGGGR